MPKKTTIPPKPPLLGQFPDLTPYSSGYLDLDDTHQMYWEQSGNPDGVPVVVLHGGPGCGSNPRQRRYFDPDHYRIILFDQRGSGKSHPHGTLEGNTRVNLVADIEKLRTHLSIDRWHIFGGSWGSTLALSYAAAHAERCITMTLRGIFLMERADIDWFMVGIKNVFPEAWEQFANFIPEDERGDLLGAYYKRLTGDDKKIQMDAAIRWTLYESACSSLIPNYETITTEEQKAFALAVARIECHYFCTEMIASENSLLKQVNKFRNVPSVIVHGRYDMICPVATAYALHCVWPEADYVVVPDAGHSALDPPLLSRLIEATENAKNLTTNIR